MNTDQIASISQYCDRWCERCAFTLRCSTFACEAAAAMCGDIAQGMELALGTPAPEPGDAEAEAPSWPAEPLNVPPSSGDDGATRAASARRSRRSASPIGAMADDYWPLSMRWIEAHYDDLQAAADAVVREALQVVARDTVFIGAKLHRALAGRERSRNGEAHDHPVQNDWNGSAKIGLIAIERSEAAWRVLSQAVGHPLSAEATTLADALRDLRQAVRTEFPNAMAFVRPGFDEPWR